MAEILFLEPFYCGSHRYFADGFIEYSRHNINLLTLPGRHWKWRMESAALEMCEKMNDGVKADLVLATNLMDLAQWKAFSGQQNLPLVLYVHENQLDYPLNAGEKRDYHYGWKDYINYLTANRIIFNSRYNLYSFCSKMKAWGSSLPGFKPDASLKGIRKKSLIIPPGCRLIDPAPEDKRRLSQSNPPVFLWNHRWEHDKNPEGFFRFLRRFKETGREFRLILLGESFRNSPSCFREAELEFAAEMIHSGYAQTRESYENWVRKADFVFSTAFQENFGISIIEAVSAGVIPLLPERLAYPEVIQKKFHSLLIYSDEEDLYTKALHLIDNEDLSGLKENLINSVKEYGWEAQIQRFDNLLESMTQRNFSANL